MTKNSAVCLRDVEHLYIPGQPGDANPPLVFLHEGLGSVSRWRTFPIELRDAIGRPPVFAYSRFGYGRSPARGTVPSADTWMADEATGVLPQLVAAVGFDSPLVVGHSDGATIAALYAAAGHRCCGLVLIAPHFFVEARTLDGVRQAQTRFADHRQLERLAAHHDDPAFTVNRWCDAWQAAPMRDWTIVPLLADIKVPILVVQGREDAYGSDAQAAVVARHATGPVETLLLADVGHEPHFEATTQVVTSVAAFARRIAKTS